ncbi:MAG: hypothetical protein QOE19_2849 [Actinomycetota bacterium]|nr:hypothetical protein [Actinomycetota bacterium]
MSPRPPLRRSLTDRKVAGVAGGLGSYFNVDPLIFRVVLVTLAVFGGSGLLLYAVGWLLIPEEGEDESEASRLVNGRATSKIVGALILGVIGLVAIGNFAQTGFGFGGFAALAAIAVAAYLTSRGDTGWRPGSPSAAVPPTAAAPHPGHTAYGPAPYPSTPYPPQAPGAYGQTPGTAYAAAPGTTLAPTVPPLPPAGHAPPTWTPPPPTPRRPKSPLGRITVSLALLTGGLLVAWNIATDHDVPAEVVLAACLGVVALGLVVGAFVGRARGLIALGIVLTIATSIAGVSSGVNLRGGMGERHWAPQSVAAVERHGDYRLGLGDAELDLSNVAVPAGQTVEVDVRLGVGGLTVIVPPDVTVAADADARAGALRILAEPSVEGTDLHVQVTDPAGASPVIVLRAHVGAGEIEVRRATS